MSSESGCHKGPPFYGSADPLVPQTKELPIVREAAMGCKACHLWQCGTQTVFGEGRENARIMLVGEQPGDKEDLEGRPFVGPAGHILDEALEEAGINRDDVYVTNAVKHFKWTPSGSRRLHQKPNRAEIVACKPWLDAEIELIQPDIVVLLGNTAAQSIMGNKFKLTESRGQFFETPKMKAVTATIHPSAVLRMPDSESRMEAMQGLIRDLRLVAEKLKKAGARAYAA